MSPHHKVPEEIQFLIAGPVKGVPSLNDPVIRGVPSLENLRITVSGLRCTDVTRDTFFLAQY